MARDRDVRVHPDVPRVKPEEQVDHRRVARHAQVGDAAELHVGLFDHLLYQVPDGVDRRGLELR